MTMGTVWVAFLAALIAGGAHCDDDVHVDAHQISGKARQTVGVAVGIAGLEHETLAFDQPNSFSRPLKCAMIPTAGCWVVGPGVVGLKIPTRAILAGCWAPAVSGAAKTPKDASRKPLRSTPGR